MQGGIIALAYYLDLENPTRKKWSYNSFTLELGLENGALLEKGGGVLSLRILHTD